ncbi:hypothetical protein G6F56_004081 [Rhizopus delemar]|nr:hypothetical protein G6F56_004081 [Rhizopus delemar]
MVRSCRWIASLLGEKNGLPIHKIQLDKPRTTIYVDASDTGWGVASTSIKTSGYWTEEECETSINVRELKTIWFALRLHAEKFHDSTIKFLSDNRTAIKYVTKAGGTSSVLLQELAIKIQELCNIGPSQPEEDPTIRGSIIQQDISENSTTMESVNHRRIHDKSQQEVEEILEPPTRFRSSSTGCFQPTVAEEGYKNQERGIGDTVLANAILVSDVIENDTTTETNGLSNEEMDHDRMAIIRRSRQKQGVSKTAAKFLPKATRSNTNKAYDKGWRRWSDWCQRHQPSLDLEEYQVQYVLEFLMDNNQYSYQTLNGLRSAIASVFKVLHPYQPALADQQLIANFFKAKRRIEIRIPSCHNWKHGISR